MPTDDQPTGKVVAVVENPLGPEVVRGEIIDAMPGRKDLILAGRAALAELGVDPDDLVDARTEEQLRRATPENTLDAMRWAMGFVIRYCGLTGRRHDPATVGTMRKLICDAFYMVDAQGRGRGRYGQPYAPKTIELVIYAYSMICNRMQWVNPCRHPLVSDQLDGYRLDFTEAGYRTDESDALSHAQSVVLGRSQDQATVQGLRNATMLRCQFDLGCRADEWCKVQGQDIRWLSEDKVLVTFCRTKGRKRRTVSMQSVRWEAGLDGRALRDPLGQPVPAADWDVDPVRLLLAYWRARQSGGWDGTGPLWVEVARGDRRKDFEETGVLGGRFLAKEIEYNAYAMVFTRAVAKTGIDRDPVTKQRSHHFTTHSNRIGMIDTASRLGFRLEDIAPRTGHSPASPVIHQYLRHVPPWDAKNPGVAIRQQAGRDGEEGRQD